MVEAGLCCFHSSVQNAECFLIETKLLRATEEQCRCQFSMCRTQPWSSNPVDFPNRSHLEFFPPLSSGLYSLQKLLFSNLKDSHCHAPSAEPGLFLHDSCIGFSCWEIPISMSWGPLKRAPFERTQRGLSEQCFLLTVDFQVSWLSLSFFTSQLKFYPVVSRSFRDLKMQQQQESPRLQDLYAGFLLFCHLWVV